MQKKNRKVVCLVFFLCKNNNSMFKTFTTINFCLNLKKRLNYDLITVEMIVFHPLIHINILYIYIHTHKRNLTPPRPCTKLGKQNMLVTWTVQ
jgi:hypothetical protein